MHWFNMRWRCIILFIAISVVECQYCSFASSASFTPINNVGTDRYIFRPCEDLDEACISEFFFRHSNGYCRKPTGQPTNNFHVHDNFSVFFPKYNVTMRDHEDRSYRFDKAEITEFFVNFYKDIALLSVKFWGFTTDGGTTYIHYKRRQEPKALHTTTKNVFEDPIVRPCGDFSQKCVSKFFQCHSKCKKPTQSDIKSFKLGSFVTYFPNHNVTMIDDNDREFSFEKAQITEFFYNKHSKAAILSVRFSNITISGGTKYVQDQKETNELVTTTTEKYEYVETTTQFLDYNCLSLEKSFTHAFVSTMTNLDLGSGFRCNRDVTWLQRLNGMTCGLSDSLSTIHLNRAPAYAAQYIQSCLCDFGKTIPETSLYYYPIIGPSSKY